MGFLQEKASEKLKKADFPTAKLYPGQFISRRFKREKSSLFTATALVI